MGQRKGLGQAPLLDPPGGTRQPGRQHGMGRAKQNKQAGLGLKAEDDGRRLRPAAPGGRLRDQCVGDGEGVLNAEVVRGRALCPFGGLRGCMRFEKAVSESYACPESFGDG